MKVKGSGLGSDGFWADFGHRIGRGARSEGRRSAPVGPFSAERWWTVGICLGCERVGSAPATAGVPGDGLERALGCWWARADDVAKRRRQGLVACRAALPFEGLDARPGVTLAPTFFAAVACQSRTIRA